MDKPSFPQIESERMPGAWLSLANKEDHHHREPSLDLDRMLNAWTGRFTAHISPATLAIAYVDWITHLQLSPSRKQELLADAWEKFLCWNEYRLGLRGTADSPDDACIAPLPQDKRFSDEGWQRWPYNVMSQGFLLSQQWWHRATTGVNGITPHHEDVVTFAARQWLDMFSPSNFFLTNPVVLDETIRTGGRNLLFGAMNAFRDWENNARDGQSRAEDKFKVGETMAVTPGKVVFRNRLIELIQYTPSTKSVHALPLLFVPAWIMKYYILDLSPHNSLVKYLVGKGYTVFMISWKNPVAADRDLSMEDYRRLGVMEALDTISSITGAPQINAVGYCLGGTLLSIAAAAMARDGDQRLASMSLFASQVDFKEPGELSLFIDESQLASLEAAMWEQGYLDTRQMAGAFKLLRSNDLIWSRRLNHYLLGIPEQKSDLMAWNDDATRMPYRMHSEYLRSLFLKNSLAEGRYRVEGKSIALADIRVPIFSVGTLTDHVAPWRSAFKVHLLTDSEVTFLLTTGGHNAGVVSPPGHPRRSYQIATHAHDEPYVDPDIWQTTSPSHEGSWWPAWEKWLSARSGKRIKPPVPDTSLCDAPGTYVLQP
jgi:poly[(R)-3-hydroxyalkanoate] polymerase subunit PhaC